MGDLQAARGDTWEPELMGCAPVIFWVLPLRFWSAESLTPDPSNGADTSFSTMTFCVRVRSCGRQLERNSSPDSGHLRLAPSTRDEQSLTSR
jgi:hypothetical protein